MTELYLGDGVYATYVEGSAYMTLYTWNGIEVTNTIYLEPETADHLFALLEGAKRIRGKYHGDETDQAVTSARDAP